VAVEAQVGATLGAVASAGEPTFANTVEPLERDHLLVSRVLTPLYTLAGSDTTPELQALGEALAPRVAALSDCVGLDPRLYARLRLLSEDDDLDDEQRHLATRRLTDMTLAGAGLDVGAAAEVREINGRLATLGAEFDRRLLADTADLAVVFTSCQELDGLSEAEIDALARPEADGGATSSASRTRRAIPTSPG